MTVLLEVINAFEVGTNGLIVIIAWEVYKMRKQQNKLERRMYERHTTDGGKKQ